MGDFIIDKKHSYNLGVDINLTVGYGPITIGTNEHTNIRAAFNVNEEFIDAKYGLGVAFEHNWNRGRVNGTEGNIRFGQNLFGILFGYRLYPMIGYTPSRARWVEGSTQAILLGWREDSGSIQLGFSSEAVIKGIQYLINNKDSISFELGFFQKTIFNIVDGSEAGEYAGSPENVGIYFTISYDHIYGLTNPSGIGAVPEIVEYPYKITKDLIDAGRIVAKGLKYQTPVNAGKKKVEDSLDPQHKVNNTEVTPATLALPFFDIIGNVLASKSIATDINEVSHYPKGVGFWTRNIIAFGTAGASAAVGLYGDAVQEGFKGLMGLASITGLPDGWLSGFGFLVAHGIQIAGIYMDNDSMAKGALNCGSAVVRNLDMYDPLKLERGEIGGGVEVVLSGAGGLGTGMLYYLEKMHVKGLPIFSVYKILFPWNFDILRAVPDDLDLGLSGNDDISTSFALIENGFGVEGRSGIFHYGIQGLIGQQLSPVSALSLGAEAFAELSIPVSENTTLNFSANSAIRGLFNPDGENYQATIGGAFSVGYRKN